MKRFRVFLALLLVTGLVEDFMMAMLCIAIIIIGLVSLLGMGGGFAVAKGSRVVTVVVGILMVIVGIYGLFNLDGAADLVMTVIGVILIISGILQLVEFYQLKKVSS